jgi:hypothetical protein
MHTSFIPHGIGFKNMSEGRSSASGSTTGTSAGNSSHAASSVDEQPRFVGNKPVLALKRFADDLSTSNNSDAARFKELNRLRVDNFIKKPIEDTNKLHESYNPTAQPHQRSSFYDYSQPTQTKSIDILNAAELQRFCLCLSVFVSLSVSLGVVSSLAGRWDQSHDLAMAMDHFGING